MQFQVKVDLSQGEAERVLHEQVTQAALLLKNEIDLRVESLKAELDRLRAAQFCAIDDQIRLLSTHSLQKIKEMRHNKEIAENIEQEIDKKELVVKFKYEDTDFAIDEKTSLFRVEFMSNAFLPSTEWKLLNEEFSGENIKNKRKIKIGNRVDDLAYLGENRLATCGNFETKIWNLETGACEKVLRCDATNLFSLSGNRLVLSARSSHFLTLWNWQRLESNSFKTDGAVGCFDLLSNGTLVCKEECYDFTKSYRASAVNIVFWRVGATQLQFDGKIQAAHQSSITSLVALSEDKFASACLEGLVKIWASNRALLREIRSDFGCVKSMRVSPVNERHLVGVLNGTVVKLWDWDTGESLRCFESDEVIRGLGFFDGELLMVVCESDVKFVEMSAFECVFKLPVGLVLEKKGDAKFNRLQLVDGKRVLSAHGDEIVVFDLHFVNSFLV